MDNEELSSLCKHVSENPGGALHPANEESERRGLVPRSSRKTGDTEGVEPSVMEHGASQVPALGDGWQVGALSPHQVPTNRQARAENQTGRRSRIGAIH